jgi:hypothetical protein
VQVLHRGISKKKCNPDLFFCLAKTQLVGIDCCCHLWECAESECTLHFANVIVQNGSWAERLCKLEAVDDLQ